MTIYRQLRMVAAGLVAVALLTGAVACGDDDDDDGASPTTSGGAPTSAAGTPSSGGAEASVGVTLKEFEIILDTETAPAGSVTFSAENIGPEDPHELVVVKTELAPGDLPTSDDGSADEEGEGVELIGEIEEFAVGGTEEATFDLEAGSYVLLCNVVEEEDGVTESHYANGMATAFTVE